MEPPNEAILIAILIVLSSLFSGSETALTSFGETRIARMLETLKAKGRRHRILELWHTNPNRVLTAVLVGNNLVNIAASALATDLSYQLVTGGDPGHGGEAALALAVGVMTFVTLVFGEIVPKTFAKHNPERFVGLLHVLTFFYWLLYVPTVILERLSRFMVHMVGGSVAKEGPSVTDEDIEDLIKLGGREGAFDEHKGELLNSVLDFADTLVREVLVPRTDVIGFEVNDPFEKVVAVTKEQQFSRYPVYEETVDHIVGVFHVKDMLDKLEGDQITQFNLRDLMRAPIYVPETKRISELMRELQRNKVHLAVVVDEFGGTAGIVTIEDIIEEIFGEIYDETDDEEEPEIQEMPDGTWVADARMSIKDLEDMMGLDFPDESDYETLGGFIIMHAGKVPEVSEVVRWNGLLFTVADGDSTRVSRVVISRYEGEGSGADPTV
ncbi:MAG: membrane protein [Myxococcales bacterium]